MTIQFDTERIVIFNHGLLFDPYYFAIAGEPIGKQWDEVVKNVLHQWAEALARQNGNQRLFLPFGIYDQCMECLEVSLSEGQVTLRCVWLDIEGWSIDLLDLGEFMTQNHSVIKASPETFGVFNRLDLVAALKGADQASA